MEPRWFQAICLGKRFASDACVIALKDGRVVRTGTVRAYPGVALDRQLLDGIKG